MGFEYFKNFTDLFDALSEDCTEHDKFTSGFSKIDECLSGGGSKRGEIFAWIGMTGKRQITEFGESCCGECKKRQEMSLSLC